MKKTHICLDHLQTHEGGGGGGLFAYLYVRMIAI